MRRRAPNLMTTSLRDIPGASGRPGRRRRRDTWQSLDQPPRPAILSDPRQGLGRPSSATRRGGAGWSSGRRRRLSAFDTALVLAVLAVALFLGRSLWSATRVHVDSTGLAREDALTTGEAERLAVRIKVEPAGTLESSTLLLDGEPLEQAERLDDGYRWTPSVPLTAGEHRLELSVPRPVLAPSRFVWAFDVDPTPPTLDTPTLLRPRGMDDPVTIRGRVADGETLTVAGDEVELDDDGAFSVAFDRPPPGPVRVVASDAAGHVVEKEVFVPVERPVVKGVHMSAISWRTDELREPVLRLIDEGKINTVELDLKDEGGEVGYDSELPLPRRIGATKGYYDLEKVVDELHERGVRVIGRMVAFRDPILARAAWDGGDRDWVVQTPDGHMLGAYGGFTNFASREVQQYNFDIAAEAVAAGVDEILWDYVRRPEGDLTQAVFPGIPSTDQAIEEGIVQFLRRGHHMLRAKGAFQGASLFGVAAGDPQAVGQNVPRISKHVDYIAPMVYPSLWVPGQYKVPDPAGQPREIVSRSVADFLKKSEGTGVQYTPWLQDFSLGRPAYGDREVREQIKAIEDLEGVEGWLLWSPRVKYHAGRLERIRD